VYYHFVVFILLLFLQIVQHVISFKFSYCFLLLDLIFLESKSFFGINWRKVYKMIKKTILTNGVSLV